MAMERAALEDVTAVMFLVLCFDLWPLTKTPSVMQQPALGIADFLRAQCEIHIPGRFAGALCVHFSLRCPCQI